jgi:hypothetical protein
LGETYLYTIIIREEFMMKKRNIFYKTFMAAVLVAFSMSMLAGCGTDTGRSSDEVITEEEDRDTAGMVHLESSDDVNSFIDEVYGAVSEDILPSSLATTELSLNDEDTIEYHTGIVNLDGIDGIYLSEPMMSSVAYSAIYVRTDDSADAQAIRDELMEKVNPSKWVCVTAEKQSAVVIGNDVFFVMGAPETVDSVMENAINSAQTRGMKVSDTVERTNPL